MLLSTLLPSENGLVVPHHIEGDMTPKAVLSFSRTPRSSYEATDVSPKHRGRVIKGK
jgi:hypothetical protein